MWYRETSDGKYKFYERYIIEYTGKEFKPSVTMTSNSKQAERKAKQILDQKYFKKINEMNSLSHDLTFKDISEQWFETVKDGLKSSTKINLESRLRIINKEIGSILLSKLKTLHVNQFFIKSIKKRSYKTVAGDKSIISRILIYAADNQMIEMLPYQTMLKVPKKNTQKEKQDWKYLERDELKSVFQQLESMNQHAALNLAKIQVATGMRFNEITALDYTKDIDFKEKTVHIRRNYDHNNNIFTTPKTGDERKIYVTDEVLDIIKEQIQISKLKTLKYNADRDLKVLFINRNGRPENIARINHILQKIEIENKKISTHIFRHTFITLMVEAGVDKNLIAKQVGHSSTKMIDRVYSHFTDEMDKRLKAEIMKHKII